MNTSTYVGTYQGYPIFVSDKSSKKYFAVVNNRKVYFGAKGYQHYFDKMGYYSSLNHLDPDRKRRFLARHKTGPVKKGTAKFFAINILW